MMMINMLNNQQLANNLFIMTTLVGNSCCSCTKMVFEKENKPFFEAKNNDFQSF